MRIVGGPASKELAERVAKVMGLPLIELEWRSFPDSESYLRFTEDLDGVDVVIIQTTSPPQDTRLLQLLMLVDGAKDLGARSVTAVVPYLAYCRQDKRFRSGEVISALTVLKVLQSVGVDRLITVNVHSPKVLAGVDMKTENLSAISLLARHLKERGLEGAFSLAPDRGAIAIAREADSVLGGGYGWLEKQRDRLTGKIEMEEKRFDVKGRDVIVFDDMISTGGTTSRAVEILRGQGARSVYAVCVHPLMIEGARERIMESGAEEIIGTDTVPGPYAVVSVAPIIADALR